MDLRCKGKKQAALADGLIEIKCDSRICGARRGVVVLHYFDPLTGLLEKTERFRDPVPKTSAREEERDAAQHNFPPVRSA